MTFRTLAPSLLLAAPRMGDPNFERTVVLLGRHEPAGALGWVMNGQAVAPVRELLQLSGLVPGGVTLPSSPAFERAARVGGPVSPQTGWLLWRRTAGEPVGEAIEVGSDIAATGDSETLARFVRGQGPADFRLVLGYAGWGPGQLEEELRHGSWLPTGVDAKLLFGTEPEQVWDAAYKSATGDVDLFNGKNWGSA